ncbi:hypothetical protein BSL78_02082 [Apostichopus japonicus]|uniref:BZIP domain-containing protein n=1 Tax=Stichopus japonicus TaxID=307972 RepID=A0A2G8LKW1_STIJA|nr:hypothetical protein BSL78_02082 [Apostichopus japonicus]
MCVCESGSDTDSNIGESRSSEEDQTYTLDSYQIPQTDSRERLERIDFPLEDERVSPVAQQETLSDHNSVTDQTSLLCFATISATATVTALRATLKRSHSSESEVCLRHASSDPVKDEKHFEISPQISQESLVFNNDEQYAHATGLGSVSVFTQVTAPNHHCNVPGISLPLSPNETEEFDEMKSLEAINKVASTYGDPALSSDLQNVDTTPFVKEELKEKIKLRRKQRGLPSLKVEEDSPKPDILTPAEEEKRRLRRERNRLAAAKCRRKKKAKAKEKKVTNQFILEQNKALLEEKYELMEEKATLEKMLRNHLMHCDRNGSVQIEVPDITSVKINMSPLEISDSDSMEEEAMFFADETLSSDSDSIDLTNDVGDQLLDSSWSMR